MIQSKKTIKIMSHKDAFLSSSRRIWKHQLTSSGRVEMVAAKVSDGRTFSGRYSVLDKRSNDGGTFSLRLKSNHWWSWSLSRSSDKPYALIPLALQACWSSHTAKESTPSCWIIYKTTHDASVIYDSISNKFAIITSKQQMTHTVSYLYPNYSSTHPVISCQVSEF